MRTPPFVLIAALTLCPALAQDKQPESRPAQPESEPAKDPLASENVLTKEEQARLELLLEAKTEETFNELINGTISENPRCILIVTYLMIELPWVPELEPKHRGDERMRKARVEQVLDHLVSGGDHDSLSANYFRAVVFPEEEKQTPKQAADTLLRWTIERLAKFTWDGERRSFSVTGEKGGD